MTTYTVRDDEPIRIKAASKLDPQAVGDELSAIAQANAGELRPRAVVEAAKSKRSPLHHHFEWDDAAAADAYRLDQARSLIRIIRVEDASVDEGNTRAFVSVSDKGGTAYRPVSAVKRSPEFQLAVMRSALRDLEAFKKRYRGMGEICGPIDTAMGRLRRQIDEQAEAPLAA